MYKIRHLDSFSETLLLYYPLQETLFFPIHYKENVSNYNTLSTTLYIGF
jgi:hypothetical protein